MPYKFLLEFSKIGKMKYVGHLDLLKLFQRAVKRSGLPVAYSQGFNPHQRMSFALPLPLGAEGLGELVEIELQRHVPPDEIIQSLNHQTPAGLSILRARPVVLHEKSAASQVTAAAYEICLPKNESDAIIEKAKAVLLEASVPITIEHKNGTREIDIRPDILELGSSQGGLSAILSAGGRRNLKPERLADALNFRLVSYRRRALLTSNLLSIFDNTLGLP